MASQSFCLALLFRSSAAGPDFLRGFHPEIMDRFRLSVGRLLVDGKVVGTAVAAAAPGITVTAANCLLVSETISDCVKEGTGFRLTATTIRYARRFRSVSFFSPLRAFSSVPAVSLMATLALNCSRSTSSTTSQSCGCGPNSTPRGLPSLEQMRPGRFRGMPVVKIGAADATAAEGFVAGFVVPPGSYRATDLGVGTWSFGPDDGGAACVDQRGLVALHLGRAWLKENSAPAGDEDETPVSRDWVILGSQLSCYVPTIIEGGGDSEGKSAASANPSSSSNTELVASSSSCEASGQLRTASGTLDARPAFNSTQNKGDLALFVHSGVLLGVMGQVEGASPRVGFRPRQNTWAVSKHGGRRTARKARG